MNLVSKVRVSVIGRDTAVETPFGVRRVTYADYTASGRSLTFIEEYIREQVLPLYANTHTETSGTGLQTTRFREEARSIIRESVGATQREHAVIFAGNGATGAVDRLIVILGIRLPPNLADSYGLKDAIPPDRRPVVFVGPYEHHSNELPWRESIADVVEIDEDEDGQISLHDLETNLVHYANRPLKIGSFSAASNVTGIISDTTAISTLLHQHGALSFYDFAAAAPYVSIRMGSAEENLDYKDAIFISPHKLIGGPGTPGVLVARKDLLTNTVPSVPGGGTVQYVTKDHHLYIADPEHREEGGTPEIIGAIRAGLAFELKEQVGTSAIRDLEHDFITRAIRSWETNTNIEVLGNNDAERLSIVSFVVRAGDRVLHHNYVVALLNDIFGIQARGGCSCAGPYGHRLLGIDVETSARLEEVITSGCEVIKPGWVRLNFNYFISEDEFQYLLEAVHMVASDGWKLLPLYTFEAATGIWRHRNGLPKPPLSLREFDPFAPSGPPLTEPESVLAKYLEEAKRIFDETPSIGDGDPLLSEAAEELRWFPTPTEAAR